ncbi:sulfatase-like hydrolase/transferase [Sulfuriroseicoccus oceanibius]|uniref:Sulfatase-like hydrolase/transferase n=1 Tax=Sulfuriroseicoccus oceanibius TaxID=2707525 RepID=A0A7T7JB72_9BACT|nr:sulfatase-like hydrolase/transferase [Sulfuriroseicoccus oceanibius]QQL43947.1 sulfatase-like hydrolase/transferase [Sulfuriroseicoccus oceanibius]
MMKRLILSCVGLVFALASVSAEVERPNLLVFLVDDMGVMDTSLPFLADKDGQPKRYPLNERYRTPSMERMGEQSLRFSRFYAHSVCSPSRISLITGQGSARHRTTTWVNPFQDNGELPGWNWVGPDEQSVTLPRLLQSAGYRTIHCGKAHFGPVGKPGEDPLVVGFDVNIAGCSWGQPGSYYGERNYGEGRRHAVPGLDAYHGSDTFLTEALTLEMKSAIAASVRDGKPFFAHMSHYALHAPFESDPRFAANYASLGGSAHAKAFATLVEGMDKSLGDLIDHLEQLGVAEETLIVFLGDNGTDAPIGGLEEVACAAPLRGKKGTRFEGGTRAPLMIGWAKLDADHPVQRKFPVRVGLESNTFATINDLFPTLLEVAGVKSPDGHVVDGESLADLLAGNVVKRSAPKEFLMHFPHRHNSSWFTSLHQGEWKLIYNYRKPAAQRYELYHLAEDPSESRNLAAQQPEKLKLLVERMVVLLNESDAVLARDANSGEAVLPVVPGGGD